MNRRNPSSILPRGLALAALLSLLLGAVVARAQDSFRASIAGEEAVEQQKREQANAKYNFKAGPLKLRFGADMSVEVTDNVDRSEKTRKADLSLRPSVDVTAMLPVTDRHTFVLNMGVGYAKYLRSAQLDHIFMTPNSTLSYDMRAGDFLIDLHSRFTYTEEDYSQFEISRTADATLPGNGYFKNTSGFQVSYDVRKYLFTLGFDHEIYQATKTNFQYQNHSSELITFSVFREINPTTRVGFQVGGGTTAYDNKVQPVFIVRLLPSGLQVIPTSSGLADQTFYNFGPAVIYQPSEHVKIVLYSGYTVYQSEGPTFAPFNFTLPPLYNIHTNLHFRDNSSTAAFYADLRVTHQLNKVLTYILNAGRQIRLGVDTDTSDVIYTTLDLNWNYIRKVSLSTPIRYQHETRGQGSGATILDSWQTGISAGYQLTESAQVNATYNYTLVKAAQGTGSYYENQLVLDLRYTF